MPPRRHVGTVDRDLESITLMCLGKEPSRRYVDAASLAQDLDRWVRGESVQARRVSGPGRLWRRAVRHRRVVVPIAVLTSVLLCLLTWTGARAWRTAGEVRDVLRAAAVLEQDGERCDDASRREALWREAQARLQWVTGRDPENPEAQREMMRLEGRLAELRRQQDLARQVAALEKAERVDEVILRFADLSEEVLWPMEAQYYDDTIRDIGQKRARNAGTWKQVEAFMAATPADAASRATMWACAGWARRLAGYEKEGIEWMRKADNLDSEVPYGALHRALVYFSKYVDRQPLPPITFGVSKGVEFGPAAPETAEMKGWRQEMDRAMAEAEGRLVWGRQEVRHYRAALESMRAVQDGRYGEAIEALTKTIRRREMAAIRFGMLLARGKVRYLTKAFDEACSLDAGEPGSYVNRGIARWRLGQAEIERGLDALGSYEKAISEYGEALRRNPEATDAYNNRGKAFAGLGSAQAARGVDPRDSYQAAIVNFDAARPSYEKALAEAGTEPPEDPGARSALAGTHYNLTCIYALASVGRASPGSTAHGVSPAEAARLIERAFRHLRVAGDLGWADGKHLLEDSDLEPLHDDPRWSELLRRFGWE